MDLGRLLYERVRASHEACGGPVEPYDEFVNVSGRWVYYPLGLDGVLGIYKCPERDGDALVIALPSRPSYRARHRALEVMRDHLGTGRCLYTMAWKNHLLALHINQKMGGEILGFDQDGYIHFKHTAETLRLPKRL
jgi:hypothetical protein